MHVLNSNFRNIKSSNYGGAIYVKMQDQYKRSDKKLPSSPSFLISNSNFEECESSLGGVIYNENADFFKI
jgi:hypothetical protein